MVQPVHESTAAFDLSGGGHWLKMTPTLVTENVCLGVGFNPPNPDPAWMKAGRHSAMDKRTGKQQKPVFLQPIRNYFVIVLSIVTEIAVV